MPAVGVDAIADDVEATEDCRRTRSVAEPIKQLSGALDVDEHDRLQAPAGPTVTHATTVRLNRPQDIRHLPDAACPVGAAGVGRRSYVLPSV